MNKYNIFFVALLLVAFQANTQCGENAFDEAWEQRKINAISMIQKIREEDCKKIRTAISNGTLEAALQEVTSRKPFTIDIGPKANGDTFGTYNYSINGSANSDYDNRELLATNGMLHPKCDKKCLELLRSFGGGLMSANPSIYYGREPMHVGVVTVGIYKTTLAHETLSELNWKKLADIIRLGNVVPNEEKNGDGDTLLEVINGCLKKCLRRASVSEIVDVYAAMKEKDPYIMARSVDSYPNSISTQNYLFGRLKREMCEGKDAEETCPDYTELMAQLEQRGVL